ncbi:MAG: response regulator, partial [Rhodocyclales bacterium]|nr:response regulator [Rhodocyclales bacterium]
PATDARPLATVAAAIAGARILLVEDNALNQQVACAFLENAGLTVCVANNGQEALAALEAEAFDAVLMDLQLPVMGGIAATRHLRADPRWQHLPVIALTAAARAQDREECLAAGMNEHVAKPVDAQRLIEVLLRFIPSRQATRQATRQGGTPADGAAVAALARDLDVLLRQHDFVAPEILTHLHELLAAAPEPLRQLEQAISRYDYDKARRALADAARALNIALEQDS